MLYLPISRILNPGDLDDDGLIQAPIIPTVAVDGCGLMDGLNLLLDLVGI